MTIKEPTQLKAYADGYSLEYVRRDPFGLEVWNVHMRSSFMVPYTPFEMWVE